MKKLLILAVMVCLSLGARKAAPLLTSSCLICDSTQVVDWGDGTYRSVIEIAGDGYAPFTVVRVIWSDSYGPLWSFDCLTDGNGSFAEVWTDVPPGDYAVSVGQPRRNAKLNLLASIEVKVL